MTNWGYTYLWSVILLVSFDCLQIMLLVQQLLSCTSTAVDIVVAALQVQTKILSMPVSTTNK